MAINSIAVGNDDQTRSYASLSAAATALGVSGGGGGSGAPVMNPTAVKTANYTASVQDIARFDATSGALTCTLPTAPADASRVTVKKIDSSTHAVAVTAGGSDVFNKTGGSTSLSLPYPNTSITVQYFASASVWIVVSTDPGSDARYSDQRALTDVTNWTATTAYAKGQIVLSPVGAYIGGVRSLVQSVAAFTSGGSFSGTNWLRLADIDALSAAITISGTATPGSNNTDTTIATASTIPAASLAAGQMYRIDLDGNFDNIATSGTFTVKIKVNGTSTGAMQIANNQTSGQTLKAWSVSQRLYIEATGSSGSVTATAGFSVQAAGGTFGIPQFTQLAATTVDLSSGLIVTVTVQNSTANAGNITRLLHGTITQAV